VRAGVQTAIESGAARFDRSFEGAVRDGCLSAAEAVRRGNRQAYADHLRLRFRLTHEMALRVADNRVLLTDALRVSGRIPDVPRPRSGIGRPVRLQLMTVTVGLLVLAGLFGVQNWQRQRETGRRLEMLQVAGPFVATPREAPSAEPVAANPTEARHVAIERDEWGRVTKVSAGHPAGVVAALCDSAVGSCASTEVRPSDPPFPGLRMGRLTIASAPGETATLPIRRDRRSGRWVAGTGLAPIAAVYGPAEDIDGARLEKEGLELRCDRRDGSDCVAERRSGTGTE
jgi:hypothetical protein